MRTPIFGTAVLAAISALALHAPAEAQRLFESDQKDSSVFLKDTGGLARINITDASATLGYLYREENVEHPRRYGVEFSLGLSEGRGTFFSENRLAPDAQVLVSYGRGQIFYPPETGGAAFEPLDWYTVQMGYSRAHYKTIGENDTAVTERDFDGLSASLAYNAQPSGVLLYGISLGVRRGNNIDDLDEVELVSDQLVSSNNGIQQIIRSSTKARKGDYRQQTQWPLATDIIWYPKRFQSRIGLDLFTRSDLGKGDGDFEPGVAAFLTQDGSPTHVLGGIAASLQNGDIKVSVFAGSKF